MITGLIMLLLLQLHPVRSIIDVFNILFRRDYLFWSDQPRDRIVRSYLNGTGSTIIASGAMSCVCKLKKQTKKQKQIKQKTKQKELYPLYFCNKCIINPQILSQLFLFIRCIF